MAILLLRHGETDGNANRVFQLPDTPLSPRGHEQAACLARRVAQLGVARLITSDFERARMTAAPIAALTGVALETLPLLQERNFGALRGVPYASLQHDPFALDYTPPEGESWADFHGRVARAFERLVELARGLEGNLVAVTHGLVCHAIVERHARADGLVPLRFGNTSVTIVSEQAPHQVRLLNCCAHLQASTADARGGGLV